MASTMACPHCSEEILASAKVCKHCGRDVKKRTSLLAWGCLGSLVLIGSCIVIGISNTPTRSTQTPSQGASTSPAQQAADNKRLFLENHRGDDSAREFIFRGLIRKNGRRCDSVESAIKNEGTPSWRVTCSPGYRYTFMIGPDGVPTGLIPE